MHKLDRGAAPQCLSRYAHGRDSWFDIRLEDKTSIWHALETMQGQRCAYCEGQATPGDRHIEHFLQRHAKPQFTFSWDNLFGSCDRNDSCGKHKDRQKYNPLDLIKPDIEDPEAYFLFVPQTGQITVREGLSETNVRRASETIRIFNLNGPLSEIRKIHLTQYVQEGLEASSWVDEGHATVEQVADLFAAEIEATASGPYSTAIRHTLLPNR